MVLFSVIFLVISGSSVARAQATATPTAEPIFKTATPHPTGFYDCPDEGLMVGYGTVTPAVSWLNSCSFCLSTQVAGDYTATPMPTLEGTPGTPAPTYTPTATATPEGGVFVPGVQDIELDGVSCDPAWTCITNSPYHEIYANEGTWQVHITGRSARDWFNAPENVSSSTWVKVQVYYSMAWRDVWTGYATTTGYFSQTVNVPLTTSNPASGQVRVYVYMTAPAVDKWSWVNIDWAEGLGVNAVVGPNPPAPTPTATPENNSACASIQGEGVSGDSLNAEDIFTIPVPSLHEAECIVLMPEFSIPTTIINLIPGVNFENDIYFPGASLCVRAMTIGILTILGMNIDLDFYAVIVGSMMILRKVLRS